MVKEKEQEKLENYNDLRYEIGRIWECKRVKVIPIVIGALGTKSKDFEEYQEQLYCAVNFSALQKILFASNVQNPEEGAGYLRSRDVTCCPVSDTGVSCFKVLDSASTSFQLKIKEAMHILWEKQTF